MTLQRTPKPSNAQIAAVKKHLKLEPGDGRAWLVLAQMLFHYPPGRELQHAVEQSTRLLPDNYQAWLLAARLLSHQQDAANALRWLESVARQNPELAAIQLARASLTSTHDPDDAITQFKSTIEKFPRDSRAYILLVEVYKTRGLLSDAAECLEQVLHAKPETARYWGMLAEIRLKEGQWEKAVSTATQAINLDRKLLMALEIRADAYKRTCSWDEALADYRELEKHQGQNPQLLNKLGVCLVRKEMNESAAEYFNKAIQLKPDFTEAKINQGFLYATKMQPDRAVSLIAEAVTDKGLDEKTRYSAVTALAVIKEQQRLAPFIEKAVKTGKVTKLQKTLNTQPPGLSQADKASVEKLWKLTEMCQEHIFTKENTGHVEPVDKLLFIEACAQCKVNEETSIQLWRKINLVDARPPGEQAGKEGEVFGAWQTMQARQKVDPDVLSRAQGEAWLKYWHARILAATPEKQPGQYKAILNTIGREIPTPPAHVSGTYSVLLSEIRPTVPAGLQRAVFMYLSINLVHGFCDGNGRLSRFLLAWESQSAGLPPTVVPLELREELTAGLRKGLWGGDLGMLDDVFTKARTQTGKLLQKLEN